MKKFLKHFMAVAVCLVLGVGALVGCSSANLGVELPAEADIRAAKTGIVEAMDNTIAYEEGFNASIKISGNLKSGSMNIEMDMEATVASNGEKASQTSKIDMVMFSKNMESTSKMNTKVHWGNVGENYVKYDNAAEQQYQFENQEEMLSDLPTVQEAASSLAVVGMMFGADMSVLGDLDFDAFDESDEVSYKIYKSGEDYNLVIKVETIEDGEKCEAEYKIYSADSKISAIEVVVNVFEDTREEGAEEAVWTSNGSCNASLTINYNFKDFSLLNAEKFADYEVVEYSYEIGSTNLPL